ncbi:DUF441 domain-containing protein [Bacillus sp. BGMRC 2118]|nr:DUF441 domain-containing protein [Bacillus sp. BGMRC 2118]
MFSQPVFFLTILFFIGLLAKNQSLLIAVGFLFVIKIVGLGDKLFPHIQAKGINWGVTVITIAVLVPIATGEIGFKQLGEALKSAYAWVAIASGIAVALIAKSGLVLLKEDPHITVALVFGTVLSVALFNGVAVGPLIGAGIAFIVMKFMELF